jgi:hypothetical protein
MACHPPAWIERVCRLLPGLATINIQNNALRFAGCGIAGTILINAAYAGGCRRRFFPRVEMRPRRFPVSGKARPARSNAPGRMSEVFSGREYQPESAADYAS